MVLYAGFFNVTIQVYFELFGRENVHVALFEEIKDQEEKALMDLCEFLRVPYIPYTSKSGFYNKGPTNTDVRAQRIATIVGINPQHLGPFKPTLLKLRNLISLGWMDSDVLSYEDKKFIRTFFAISNQHTAGLIGRNLRTFGYPV